LEYIFPDARFQKHATREPFVNDEAPTESPTVYFNIYYPSRNSRRCHPVCYFLNAQYRQQRRIMAGAIKFGNRMANKSGETRKN